MSIGRSTLKITLDPPAGVGVENPRMVTTSPTQLAPERELSCLDLFTRSLCCCIGPMENRNANEAAATFLENYLVQELGPIPAQATLLLAQLDLSSKRRHGDPLYANETRAVLGKATFINNNISQLEEMIHHLRFYLDGKLIVREQEIGSTPQHLLIHHELADASHSSDKDEPTVIKIQKKESSSEDFNQEILREELSSPLFSPQPTEEQITLIITNVTQTIATQHASHVSSHVLRRLLVQQALQLGSVIVRPDFLDRSFHQDIVEILERKTGEIELTPEEYAELVSILEVDLKMSPTHERRSLRIEIDEERSSDSSAIKD